MQITLNAVLRPPGLPVRASPFLGTRKLAECRERRARPSTNYSLRQYGKALELMAQWRLPLVQFSPQGLPTYQAILNKSYGHPKLAARLSAARAERIRVLCGVGIVRMGGRTRGYLPADFDAFLDLVRDSTCRSKNEFVCLAGTRGFRVGQRR